MHHKHSPTLPTTPYILGLLQTPQTLTNVTNYRVSAANILGLLHAPQTLTNFTDYTIYIRTITHHKHLPFLLTT